MWPSWAALGHLGFFQAFSRDVPHDTDNEAFRMPRDDLLHIAPDDLAALTNRGTVKRAQRELENKEVTAELGEDDTGTVTAKWSDGVTCTLPGGKTISDARCTCPATELCR